MSYSSHDKNGEISSFGARVAVDDDIPMFVTDRHGSTFRDTGVVEYIGIAPYSELDEEDIGVWVRIDDIHYGKHALIFVPDGMYEIVETDVSRPCEVEYANCGDGNIAQIGDYIDASYYGNPRARIIGLASEWGGILCEVPEDALMRGYDVPIGGLVYNGGDVRTIG